MTLGKGNSQVVYIEESSVKKLQAIDRVFRTYSTTVRARFVRELNRGLKEATKQTVADIQSAARDLTFSGESGSVASQSRARRTGRQLKTKFKLGRGLREEMAFGVRTQVDRSKYSAGVRVRMASKQRDVNRLAKLSNNKGYIRHPLFGNKDYWYRTDVKNGRNWYYQAGLRSRPMVQRQVAAVLDQHMARFKRDLDRAA